MTAVCLLAPHLTAENYRAVLTDARHKSKREIEHIVARLRPHSAVPASVRKLPDPRVLAGPSATFESPPAGRAEADSPPVSSEARPTRPAAVTPRALQGAVHHIAGDARQAPARAGSATALDPHRRSGRDLRPGPDGPGFGSGAGQACRGGASARGPATCLRFPAHSGGGEEGGVEARWRPMRLRRDTRPLYGARVSGVPPRRAVRGRRWARLIYKRSTGELRLQLVAEGPQLVHLGDVRCCYREMKKSRQA